MRIGRSISGRLAAIMIALLGLAGAVAIAAPEVNPVAKANPTFDRDKAPGRALFATHCAGCHEGVGMEKAPNRQFLEMMDPHAIVTALTSGVMQGQGKSLTPVERQQVSEFLTGDELANYKPAASPLRCTGAALAFDRTRPPAQAGWGYDSARFIPTAAAGLGHDQVTRLKLRWAFAFPAAMRARSQPLIAMKSVFVGSQDGTVYALDLASGCVRWTSKISAEIRTGIVMEPWKASTTPAHPPRIFFGDLLGRVYAMDALSGKLLWRIRPDGHPNATMTGTPLLRGDTLYVPVSSLENTAAVDPKYPCCSFRGSVVALNAATGAVKWRHFTIPEPATEQGTNGAGTPNFAASGASVWTSPTYDPVRKLIYHGSGQNYSSPADGNSDAVFAVDAATGVRRWVRQLSAHDAWTPACAMGLSVGCPAEHGPDHDVAASPLLVELGNGHQIIVAGQKSGTVAGIDPDDGHIVWQRKMGRGGLFGGVHFGMAVEGNRVFVPIADIPIGGDGKAPPGDGHPGLYAIDAATGETIWSAPSTADDCHGRQYCAPGISSAVTAMPGVVFAGHLDGWLHAYDSKTGAPLWQVDTTLPAKAPNGAIAQGGAMSGPGVAIGDGHVVVNSGYGYAMHMPGNALLVYTIDGR